MDDEGVLEFLRTQARGARSTTHWNSLHLLAYFGAIAVDERVVVDGRQVSAAGVSSAIDGALRVVQLLAGDRTAQAIQLQMQYAPEPLFPGGTLATSPPEIVALCRARVREISERRLETARRVAKKLGVTSPS